MSAAPIYEGTTPLVSDRYIISLTAGAAITMGQALVLSAAWTVSPAAAANSKNFVGIALTSQPNIGGMVSVVCRGIVRAVASGTMAAGDQVTTSATSGDVQTDNTSLNTTIIGVALSAATVGTTVYVLLW